MTCQLSIIIVSWNTRELLRQCLQSVFERIDASLTEVLVVDNASSDGSAAMVAEHFPQAQLIRNERNRGFAAANNQAMRRAAARYVLLLNSDTIALGDVFNATMRYMDARYEVGVLGCQVLNPDRSVQHTCFGDPGLWYLLLVTTGLHRLRRPRVLCGHHMPWWNRDDERDVDVVTGCFMLLRREAMESVGLFDEQFFFYAEEADRCRRFRDAGWAVRFAPVGNIVHYGGASALQLNERRALLLGEALVRLQRKRLGTAAAAIAWVLLLAFNVSRAVGGAVAALVTGRKKLRERALLFARAALRFHRAWPSGGKSASYDCSRFATACEVGEVRNPSRRYSITQPRQRTSPGADCGPAPARVAVEKDMFDQSSQRIVAIASGGGHWVQLLRLRPALAGHDVTYVTVKSSYRSDIGSEPFHVVPDATRWNKVRLAAQMLAVLLIMLRRRPHVVVTTGAAPGKLIGARTIWLDSIANVEHLSLSGQKARRHADLWLTQWPHLDQPNGPVYAGAVL